MKDNNSITIKDIAKKAGVSQATISKILNNYTDVSQKTKERVFQIMEEVGYRPSHSARTLAQKTSKLIGVIYAGRLNADFDHPFFIEVLNAFKRTIGMHGYDLLFFSDETFQKEENFYARCLYYKVDGCIIIAGDDVQQSIDDLTKSDIPCIGVDIQLEGPKSGYVMTDNKKISQSVIDYFYLQGHRDIAYIGGTNESTVSNIRLKGFRDSIKEYGLTLNPEWVIEGDFLKKGYEAGLALFKDINKSPTAVFSSSDLMAFGFMRAIHELGLSIPADVSLIGCDDQLAARYVQPPLTTVRQNKEKIGRLAALMLLDFIGDRASTARVLVEPELISRKTTAQLAP
ncbi:LOW QUALITY PROTEIN: transcriptional regulator [Bacillus sp. JCM 19046]|nr:LOW QUALITY PROTEIN: transcriptional regulator [Bacillus sp. JCM 19046]